MQGAKLLVRIKLFKLDALIWRFYAPFHFEVLEYSVCHVQKEAVQLLGKFVCLKDKLDHLYGFQKYARQTVG